MIYVILTVLPFPDSSASSNLAVINLAVRDEQPSFLRSALEQIKSKNGVDHGLISTGWKVKLAYNYPSCQTWQH